MASLLNKFINYTIRELMDRPRLAAVSPRAEEMDWHQDLY